LELTFEEENELLRLEKRVERGFYIAGKALQEIRDKKLYRQQYKTFSDNYSFSLGYTSSPSFSTNPRGILGLLIDSIPPSILDAQ
jgi:hypothetical protein